MALPSASTRSSVNTSPLECGSIRMVKLLGRVSPANVDWAAFNFQVPYGAAAQDASARGIRRKAVRMRTQCAHTAAATSLKGSEGVSYTCTSLKIGVFSEPIPTAGTDLEAARRQLERVLARRR